MDARALDEIKKKQFPRVPSSGLQWVNKTLKLRRSIELKRE